MSDIISRLRDAYMRNPAEALHMLPELFEAEERIVELPCKIGTPVWIIYQEWGQGEYADPEVIPDKFDFDMRNEMGRTVFLTRSAAEQALKEAEK